jgi:hypothetical protein
VNTCNHSTWIQWVMECVSTISYTVYFNNVQLESFKPSRGLRQGDPLSPFLFLFVADGLSRLFKKETQQGMLQELHICRRSPGISHLLFADDTMVFFKVDQGQAEVMKGLLRRYEMGTSQLISPSKCSIMFGSQCSEASKT